MFLKTEYADPQNETLTLSGHPKIKGQHRARSVALDEVRTKSVVFLDPYVVVTKGWSVTARGYNSYGYSKLSYVITNRGRSPITDPYVVI